MTLTRLPSTTSLSWRLMSHDSHTSFTWFGDAALPILPGYKIILPSFPNPKSQLATPDSSLPGMPGMLFPNCQTPSRPSFPTIPRCHFSTVKLPGPTLFAIDKLPVAILGVAIWGVAI